MLALLNSNRRNVRNSLTPRFHISQGLRVHCLEDVVFYFGVQLSEMVDRAGNNRDSWGDFVALSALSELGQHHEGPCEITRVS